MVHIYLTAFLLLLIMVYGRVKILQSIISGEVK
jgi:hypothetical protein